MVVKHPVIGIILDGFGINHKEEDNPVMKAYMPFYNLMIRRYPNTAIYASEEYVGLPKGQMGNSEVGHLTIGAGRVLYQDLMRINKDIESNNLIKNKALCEMLKRLKEKDTTLHLIGMVSNGGVHSSLDHLLAILDIVQKKRIKKVKIHCILDGRDTPVDSGKNFLQKLQIKLNENGVGQIATIIGRFYAMDREKRWERTQKAFDLFCYAKADFRANSFAEAINKVYKTNTSDEYAPGFAIGGYTGMQDGDEVLFFNFRPDRMRQISNAFASKRFTDINRGKMPKLSFTAMCMFDDKQKNIEIMFKEVIPKNTLSEVLSKQKLKQLKLAETTKYAHVTYYFNGGVETPYKGEDRKLIESKNVDNFAKYPPMRAPELSEFLVSKIQEKKYDFILINYSNCDMIGHTGDQDACVKTLEIIDNCLKSVVNTAIDNNYTCMILADHGNIEDEGGKNKTTHTTNPVPFIITDMAAKLKNGTFALDCFAPTVLEYMGIPKPKEMTGESIMMPRNID